MAKDVRRHQVGSARPPPKGIAKSLESTVEPHKRSSFLRKGSFDFRQSGIARARSQLRSKKGQLGSAQPELRVTKTQRRFQSKRKAAREGAASIERS